MKVIQRMVLKTRSTRVAATCSDESSSSGRLFGGVWMRSPGAMRRIVERWGAGAGRDDPFESPPGVLEGVGRGGVGGLVVRGGSGAPPPLRPTMRAEPAGPADLSLPELLALTVEGVLDACADLPKVRRRLQLLVDLGLGYLALGETTTALSGGEAQRLKLSNDLGRDQHGTVFVLDEPGIGLHPLDVRVLPGCWTGSWKPGPRCSSSNTIST